ncbi:NRAMP family divalent metal transporter [Aneurinibacillus aneurinilyticus]|jgi:Mn2+/Fe2+ NRAMP family transporter|uniref:Divalent metal cation transporter n=2 Tax=Aneurinibacillus aneurinilyticus TaxID=1391 RepID=A0A848D053_ANEAE|nr:NRAMP family divalent metal transporter [Aneurinibacillus aneurinilyticus]ERI08833.1 transporter, branched chain amino acid:cation symporter family protein [Aneurinibacillus aneurinilyticus ATCC 12856]MCI1695017.1 divalent metal cation transporter [Aneurinibacillus aneurinilyticus]MED0706670.1 divalent metal cation transporter [Aneurinibacillus aneurinilyticus]MED0723567.1 divalent metal cation transporter [Aneurinibacillus aneurinilyticus]MED0731689.1 divalent metal cation transporter [Ane
MDKKGNRSVLLGAAFLMATSAIGPGFLTQTTVFTSQLAASFGFVILMSIILDIGAQMNIWRVIAVSGKRAQDIANMLLPGLGYFLAFLIVIGGLAFNIGNAAGAGLGMNVMFGITPEMGALISGIIAIAIFIIKEAGKAMDRFTQVAGFVMIGLTVYVAVTSQPPLGEAVVRTFVPEQINMMAIVTLVGGTVGGYITFAGGHRLLDAGIKGKEALPQVTKGAVSAIGIASIMRIVLFLAALGIVAQGLTLDPANPPASVFQLAAGNIGYKIFGIVMWAAAITSVIGAAYTSVSFIRTFSPSLEKYHRAIIIGFIAISTLVFTLIGKPVKILVLVGALNGLILPISLGVILIAAYKTKIVGDYKHPLWLTLFGAIIVVAMAIMGGMTMVTELPKLFA